jgi:hypothetical protein
LHTPFIRFFCSLFLFVFLLVPFTRTSSYRLLLPLLLLPLLLLFLLFLLFLLL